MGEDSLRFMLLGYILLDKSISTNAKLIILIHKALYKILPFILLLWLIIIIPGSEFSYIKILSASVYWCFNKASIN